MGVDTGNPKELPDSPAPKSSGIFGASIKATSEVVGTLTNRSLFFPDIATNPAPLSPGEKFKLFVNQSISPACIVTSGMSAGFGQWRDVPAAYGQDATGYFDRFGASMARGAPSSFFGTFMLASALHQGSTLLSLESSQILEKRKIFCVKDRDYTNRGGRVGLQLHLSGRNNIGRIAGECLSSRFAADCRQNI